MQESARILVVDDDESNRESLRRRLERRGHKLSVAHDGDAALAEIAAHPFDLVILDVMMPGISGLDVLDKVRQTLSPLALPIIMATARDQSADIVEAMKRGANDYVTKPLDFEVVWARVQVQLGLKFATDEIERLRLDLAARNADLQIANKELLKNVERRDKELQAAALVQRAFLPRPDFTVEGIRFAWFFEPCLELAGDSLNVVTLDRDHVAFYVLDVSGHGVGASLLAVTATRLLSTHGDIDTVHGGAGKPLPVEPAEFITRLGQQFSIDSTGNFITLFYGVLNVRTLELTYVSAGHLPPVRIQRGGVITSVEGTGMPVGIEQTFEQQKLQLIPGDRLYLYSDGVTEAMNPDRDLFGVDRLTEALKTAADRPLVDSLATVTDALAAWRGPSHSFDDVTILALECR